MDVMHKHNMNEMNSMEVVDEIDLGIDEMHKHEMHKKQEMNATEADYEIEEVIRLRQSYFIGFFRLETFTKKIQHAKIGCSIFHQLHQYIKY